MNILVLIMAMLLPQTMQVKEPTLAIPPVIATEACVCGDNCPCKDSEVKKKDKKPKEHSLLKKIKEKREKKKHPTKEAVC